MHFLNNFVIPYFTHHVHICISEEVRAQFRREIQVCISNSLGCFLSSMIVYSMNPYFLFRTECDICIVETTLWLKENKKKEDLSNFIAKCRIVSCVQTIQSTDAVE